jgi:hypothetical protein
MLMRMVRSTWSTLQQPRDDALLNETQLRTQAATTHTQKDGQGMKRRPLPGVIAAVLSPEDTAAACKTATERVIRAAVAHVAARKDWDARGGYAPLQRQALHGTMDELIAAVEEMGEQKAP